jgi:hypothetical protein
VSLRAGLDTGEIQGPRPRMTRPSTRVSSMRANANTGGTGASAATQDTEASRSERPGEPENSSCLG